MNSQRIDSNNKTFFVCVNVKETTRAPTSEKQFSVVTTVTQAVAISLETPGCVSFAYQTHTHTHTHTMNQPHSLTATFRSTSEHVIHPSTPEHPNTRSRKTRGVFYEASLTYPGFLC